MTFSLILGNIFSLCAVICLSVSVTTNNKKSLIGWQILDTSFFIASTFVLKSYAAVTTNSVSLVRNILAYKYGLNKIMTFCLCTIMVIIGVYLNNRGIIGFLPIIASIEYTIGLYLTKNSQQMRYIIILNLLLWFIHDTYIQAYPAALNDMGISLWTAWQIFHKRVDKKNFL